MADPHLDPAGYLSSLVGAPVTITGGARSPARNAAVGGSPTSEHLTGNAWDFTVPGLSEAEVARRIVASGVPFDQVIEEGNHVHFGLGPKNRREVLAKNGKSYMPAAGTDSLSQAIASSGAATKSLDNDPLFRRAFAEVEKANDARAAAAGTVRTNLERKAALLDKPLPAIPPMPKLNDLPKPIDEQLHSDPMRVFGQFMPMMAAFGSLLTRGGAVSSLNAATAAMNAATAKDKDALERAHQQWMDTTQQTLSQNALEQEKYRAVMDQHNVGMSDRLALMQEIAAENQDEMMLANLKANPDGIIKLLDVRDKAAEHLWSIYDKAQDHDERRRQLAIEQQRADWEQHHGPVDQRIYEKWLEEHPKANSEDAAKFFTGLSAAKRATKLNPPQEAAQFVADVRLADPNDETTHLTYDGVTATPKEWNEAIASPIPDAKQIELKSRFMQANKDSIKIEETNAQAPAAPAAQRHVQRPPAPANPADRKKGWIYQGAGGRLATWDGEHWIPYNGA